MQRRSLISLPLVAAVTLVAVAPAGAVNTVTTANGANWQIHDVAPPKLDTGSIRAITDNAFYGFGGIRVRVSGIPATDPTGAPQRRADARLRAHVRRRRDRSRRRTPVSSAASASAARSRSPRPGNWTRWLDTFANTTPRTVTVDVSFGGTAGLNTANNQSKIAATLERRRADRRRRHVGPISSPNATGVSTRGPSAVVTGTQPEHRQLPARPVRRAAAGHRASRPTSTAT